MSNFSKSPSRNSWWILVIVQFWQLSYDCNKSKRGCMRKVTKVTLGCEHPLWNSCNGRNFCTRYRFSSTSMHIPGPKKYPLIESLQLLRYDGYVHWPNCWSLHHGRCRGGEDLGTSGEVHLQGRSWRGKQHEVLDYGEFGTWEWKHFVGDRSATVMFALHSCKVRHVSKAFRKSVKLRLHGWKDSECDQPGSSAQGLGLLVTLLAFD